MKESEVCTRIVNGFLEAGHEAFKIPDMPRTPGTKFNRSKGYDIVAAVRGFALQIEVKKGPCVPKSKQALRNILTDSQLKRFDRVTDAENAACFVIYCEYKPHFKSSLRVHHIYIIDWAEVKGAWPVKWQGPFKYYKQRYDLTYLFDYFPSF